MKTYLLWLTVDVKAGERVLLLKSGRYDRVLTPGRYRLLDPKHELQVERYQIVRTEMTAERYAVLKAERPDLAEALLALVETKANELAVVSLDGRPTHLMGPWQSRAFWKAATEVTIERIDTAADPVVSPRHLTLIDRTKTSYVSETIVESHEAGLLYRG